MSDVLANALMLLGVACWLIIVVSGVLVVINRNPGLPLRPNWFESPFNWIFRPGSLTNKGLTARRWVFIGAFGFVACVLLLLVLANIASSFPRR